MTDNTKKRCRRLKYVATEGLVESYRNALQAFIDRRRFSGEISFESTSSSSPDKKSVDSIPKQSNMEEDNDSKTQECKAIIPGVPHVPASDIFDVGWVAGTEDRYLEFFNAEWQNTRVSLKRHTHPECVDAVKADLEVLAEIRHPNVLLVMATTQTEDHGLISIFESVSCTLYSYIHDQGKRMSIQGIAKCGGGLADALRYAHMRGYIHGAISSHCVYLLPSGAIKLGGWELATRFKSAKELEPISDRLFEERLRTEVFRWQPPEYFYERKLRPESDVYGLCLLIWEMSTSEVPWNRYSQADVEKQYICWKGGVIMNLTDFPPFLYGILEAGLQIDVMKRALDMTKLRRLLQRLEMEYENTDPSYIEKSKNNNNNKNNSNNNNNDNTFSMPTSESSTKPAKAESSQRSKIAILKVLNRSPISRTEDLLSSERATNNTTEHAQINISDSSQERRENSTEHRNATVLLNAERNGNDDITFDLESRDDPGTILPWHSTYKKVKSPKDVANTQCNPSTSAQSNSSPLMKSISDEDIKDVRICLKRLKQAIANKREQFFYGTASSPASKANPSNENVSAQSRNQNCEINKAANRKTNSKFHKYPGEYDPLHRGNTYRISRPSHQQNVKYNVYPKMSSAESLHFFETLWKKEKMICISKMGKRDDENKTEASTSKGCLTKPANNDIEDKRPDTRYQKRDETFTVDEKPTANGITEVDVNTTTNFEVSSTVPSEPLQELKEALDRATSIIHSAPSSTVETQPPSQSFKNYDTFDISANDIQACKSLFEDIYGLNNDDNEEIKSIERTLNGETYFLTTSNNSIDKESETIKTDSRINGSETDRNAKHSLLDTPRARSFMCESITEMLNESSVSNSNPNINCTNRPIANEEASSENAQSLEHRTRDERESDKLDNIRKRDSTENRFRLMLLNDSIRDRCRSCHHRSALPRRRSLPSTLGTLRSSNISSIGRLSIRRGDVLDNTVEDLYIDDEFGDSLNVNMILMLQDMSLDDDFLPETSEL